MAIGTIPIVWDFSFLVLDDVAVPVNSFGGGGGGGSPVQSYLPPSAPTVINTVAVAIPPPPPTPADPVPQIEAVVATQPDSVTEFGTQATPVLMTLLSSLQQAEVLAQYLGRPQPSYYFTGFTVNLLRLSSGDRDAVTTLEVGDQLTVSKRVTGVTGPVVEDVFVEGIEHRIDPNNHVVVIYTSPAVLWTPFELDVSELDNPLYGLG